MSKRNHRGSDFRDFLNEEGILGEVEARALKQALRHDFIAESATCRRH